ncbi:hypothetical protein HBN50_13620 [Halobacteriovorax sp. GB3]|uniref:hypothetical protein n=1 Tax=Halobacteriovorax sp. GB3 TaxID=2719615 RepID=UPI00235E1EC0|nr:hypothetical protein [Halobacteriovorax sp. GB3]MDD0854146.1 hypothetical protein [Halobacteriovorax sp. GB3]
MKTLMTTILLLSASLSSASMYQTVDRLVNQTKERLSGKCESVDLKLAEFKVGLASPQDIAAALDCSLDEVLTGRRVLCATRLALKKENLALKEQMYDMGMGDVTKKELETLQKGLQELEDSCN